VLSGLTSAVPGSRLPGEATSRPAGFALHLAADGPILHHGDMNWREVITADPDVVHGQVRFGGREFRSAWCLTALRAV
jgi:hypothetical protein